MNDSINKNSMTSENGDNQGMPVLNFNGAFHNYGTITGNIVSPVYYGSEEVKDSSSSSDGDAASSGDGFASSGGGERPGMSGEERMPEVFRTDQGAMVVQEMIAHGMMDEHFQPLGLSQTEMGVVVVELSKRLGIHCQWKVFGELWNMKPETLRRSFYKAQEQKKTFGFYDKLRDVLP